MTIPLIITAICVASLAYMTWLAATAPEGFEDRDGFHLGAPDEHSRDDNLGI